MQRSKIYTLVSKGLLSFLILSVVLLSGLFTSTQAQVIELSADTLFADPGDTITIHIKEDSQGKTIIRREYQLDGYGVDWASETPGYPSSLAEPYSWEGDYKWEAVAGTHTLRLMIRWRDSENNLVHLNKMLILQISGWEKPGGYIHPGLTITRENLDRVRAILTGPDPHQMKTGYPELNPDLSYTPSPHKSMNMDDIDKKTDWDRDGWYFQNSVYQFALKWAISGDDRYAAKAVEILMAWATTCDSMFFDSNDVYPFLHVTHAIGGWVTAPELLKHYNPNGGSGGYAGWSQADRDLYDQRYVRRILVPLTLGWRGNLGPYGAQNQPLNVAKARMLLGIYLDDEALLESGRTALNRKDLNGLTKHDYATLIGEKPANLFEISIGLGGMYREINRDIGHTGMCISSMQYQMEALWLQGFNAYETKFLDEETPRYFQGLEWLVKAVYEGAPSDLKGTIYLPFNSLGNFEQMYNHYRYRLKDKYPLPDNMHRYVFERRKKSSSRTDFIYAELDNDTLPDAPSDLQASSSAWYQIDLTWRKHAWNENYYQIERSLDGLAWDSLNVVSPVDTCYSDKTLSDSTQYYYRVCAVNYNGKSAWIADSAITFKIEPLGGPLNFAVERKDSNSIDLSWFDNSGGETGFDIERSEDGSAWDVVHTTAANVTDYANSGLEASTKYFYRIRGKNIGGYSDYSPVDSAITLGNGNNNVWIEAESGEYASNVETWNQRFLVKSDTGASGGQYIQPMEGVDASSFPPNENGQLIYTFEVDATNTYKIWAKSQGPGEGGNDSFWIKMDNDDWIYWGKLPVGPEWGWDPVRNFEDGRKVVFFNLTKGAHTIKVGYRKWTCKLDGMLITDDFSFTADDSDIISSIGDNPSAPSNVPKEFALHHAYPNPFNPSTTIAYQLPKATDVKLIVYDILGRKVIDLVNTYQKAGNYKVVWNALNSKNGSMASGTYFVRLKTEQNVKMIKVLLLK